MRITFSVLSLLALSLGTSGLANEQLGGSIGLDASAFTTAELAQLKSAIEDGDDARVDFLLKKGSQTPPELATTVGRAQLAGGLGVSADEFTLAELSAMLLEGTSPVASATSPGSQSKEQLAMSLGVDPAEHTAAELAAMKFDAE